ncbi:Uu.00g010720.m01.CDS01 [Anthostomella pinea]|uniref:Uu.00g010720.m01.CDS01 n=1 Tax=Anthostomella pinea TaxID=933095 RepID=A0AAI8VXM2_9PEZI|nr:Uu.00g010720.m01.CDS01 [Anthostomella pinea]
MSGSTPTVRNGSCLCGSIKVRMEGEPFRTNLCHCSSCQKFSGGIFASLAVYKTDQVTYTPSSPSVMKTFTDTTPESGRVLLRYFCGTCGSPVKGARTGRDADFVVVPLGIIDGDTAGAGLKPQVEFFCRSRADWIGDVVGGAEGFETLPPPAA